LEGEADQQVGYLPGDMYLRIFTKEHDKFKRRNNDDLETTLTISLRDSLLGFTRDITLLDGSVYTLKRLDTVTKPGEVLQIPDKGMPIYGSSQYGRLLINITVEFPDEDFFTEQDKHFLRQLLAEGG
jgi:DnaJ-class molecular chaperone